VVSPVDIASFKSLIKPLDVVSQYISKSDNTGLVSATFKNLEKKLLFCPPVTAPSGKPSLGGEVSVPEISKVATNGS